MLHGENCELNRIAVIFGKFGKESVYCGVEHNQPPRQHATASQLRAVALRGYGVQTTFMTGVTATDGAPSGMIRPRSRDLCSPRTRMTPLTELLRKER